MLLGAEFLVDFEIPLGGGRARAREHVKQPCRGRKACGKIEGSIAHMYGMQNIHTQMHE